MENGICRLSLVPVRKDPADTSEMTTQLLFGDHYSVLEYSEDNKWLRIRIYHDDYEGWIDHKQHKSISGEYFDEINANDYKIATDLSSTILYKKKPLVIVMGSVLPVSTHELFDLEEQFAFNGESKNLGQKRDFEFVRLIAEKYLNAPYLWGGKSPFGIDCSGLTQMVFRISGYPLKRDTHEQIKQGEPVENLKSAKPGDLAFFTNSKNQISHVGILLAHDKIIHASGSVRIDFIDERGIFIESKGTYTHSLERIKRILR